MCPDGFRLHFLDLCCYSQPQASTVSFTQCSNLLLVCPQTCHIVFKDQNFCIVDLRKKTHPSVKMLSISYIYSVMCIISKYIFVHINMHKQIINTETRFFFFVFCFQMIDELIIYVYAEKYSWEVNSSQNIYQPLALRK